MRRHHPYSRFRACTPWRLCENPDADHGGHQTHSTYILPAHFRRVDLFSEFFVQAAPLTQILSGEKANANWKRRPDVRL